MMTAPEKDLIAGAVTLRRVIIRMMRWMFPLSCLGVCGITAQTAAGADCPGMTTLQVNACVAAELNRVDGLSNEIFGIVVKELSAGTDEPEPQPLLYSERLKTLVAAEKAWARFKDAQCAAESALVAPGTGAAALGGQCAIDLTKERIRFLRGVEAQIRPDSKLCRANKTACSLPPDVAGTLG